MYCIVNVFRMVIILYGLFYILVVPQGPIPFPTIVNVTSLSNKRYV